MIPVLLDAIVIDANNGAIAINEAAAPLVATIAAGTYFARGDGATDDLFRALRLALDAAAGGGNSYTVAAVYTGDPAAPSVSVTISLAAGSTTFRLLWASASTTADPAWFGFPRVNTALDVAPKVSSLSPSSCWVGNCAPEVTQPARSALTYGVVANSGRFAAGLVGGPYAMWRFNVAFVDGRRFDEAHIAADPNRALSRFWARAIRGGAFEYHVVDYTSPAVQTLAAISAATRIGVAWHLHEDSTNDFEGARFDEATSLWSIDTLFRAQVL